MTDKEIMEWRKKVIIDRLYLYLSRLGTLPSTIRMAEISIQFDEKRTPSTEGIKVFFLDSIEPELVSGNDFIVLVIGKLARILEKLEDSVDTIKIIAGPGEGYKFEFLSP